MNTMPRTAKASQAAKLLVATGVNRRNKGKAALILVLRFAAQNGLITEPESKILLGRTGMLKRYAKQGYFYQIPLPPGLKAAPHFPHLHYYHMTEKGMMMVAAHIPQLAGYGNLELKQRTYLHDFIGRIEAAWRLRVCEITWYIPETRLPELSSQNHKQHDGHFLLFNGERIGIEVEAADWKSGNKLALFVAQCLNSITKNRVQGVLILVQNHTALNHYAAPFQAGKNYCQEWIKESGKWVPRKSSQTVITSELSAKINVSLILNEAEISYRVCREPAEFFPIPSDYCFDDVEDC